MMKKKFCFLGFFFLFAFALCANEVYDDDQDSNDNPQKTNRLNLSAGFSYTNNPKSYGGHFEFGIDLFRNIFFVENKLLLRAGGFKADDLDNTVLTLSEKLAFGRSPDDFMDIYVYIEGGIGFYGNAKAGFSGDTLVYNFGFGGGFGGGDYDFGGIYIEVGYIGQKMASNFPLSGILVQTGWRILLK